MTDKTPEQLILEIEQLFKENKFKEIIVLLPDEVLGKYKNAILYAWRARVLGRLDELEEAFKYASKAIEINPSLALPYSIRGNVLDERKKYDRAIEDYNKAIALDNNYALVYNNRGVTWLHKKEYDKAIEDYNKAIALDDKMAVVYINRGNIWFNKKKYDKAIEDYNKAIALDDNYALAYNNRGNTWLHKNEYDKAIEDYNKAIALDNNNTYTYYNRASAFNGVSNYIEAIKNYKTYIELLNNSKDFYSQVAQAIIEELERKIGNKSYEEIAGLVDKINNLLLFKNTCLTHYTSLSGAKAMVLEQSKFRLSEGAFLNDTSEGRELFKYLEYSIAKQIEDETIAEPFVERPFIGSFVADTKHDDLTLWRMYGKESGAEAKGCALTILKDSFLNNLKDKIASYDKKATTNQQLEDQFTFYKVAYRTKDVESKFIVPGSNKIAENNLNKLMKQLREKIKILPPEQKPNIAELLNRIAFLFKSVDYQYEHEVRLIVHGVGFEKQINKESMPPKVYIDLVEIVPVLQKITLGPKVERANEWAAAFNYHIKKELKDSKVEIVISHLPFK